MIQFIRTRTLIWTLALLSMPAFTFGDDFCDLLREGKLAEAKKQFLERTEDEGMAKLYLGLGDKDAARSTTTLAQLQNPSSSANPCANVIYNRLAGYTFLGNRLGMDKQGLYQITRKSAEYSAYDSFTKRLLVASGQFDTDSKVPTLKQFDDLAKELDRDDSLWVMLDKAQMLIDSKKEKDAIKMLKAISQRDNGEQVPAALYMQIKLAFQNKKSDEALRLLGIMQEAFPYAIGLDALSATLVNEADETIETEPEAERLTKTVYSVQMGVFSTKANAQVLVKALESYKQKIDITPRVISGKEYFVVYAGKFNRYDEATAFKEKLETARKESYQVIAR